jgi:hypothetical protein
VNPRGSGSDGGQASILMLGVIATVLAVALVLAAFSQALGARGRSQRIADLSAVSGAHAMRTAYPRLFEPPQLRPGVPNPRHLTRAEYLALARAAALRAARRNGQAIAAGDVSFPGGSSFAPTRIAVVVRDSADVRVSQRERRRIRVKVRAEAELEPLADDGLGPRGHGEYSGPLAYRQGKPMRPDVARAFDRMERAARAAGVRLIVVSGFRSNAEQARLFARRPDPRWVAPPGKSLHRLGTELDLGPAGAYGWLARNAPRFGFVKRYSWESGTFGSGSGAGRSQWSGGGSASSATSIGHLSDMACTTEGFTNGAMRIALFVA